ALTLVAGFTFLARGYSYDVRHLKDLIRKAVEHKGLAFLDVLQPCPTYNDINTREWFQGLDNINPETDTQKPRTYKLDEIGYDGVIHEEGQTNDKMAQVIEKSNEWDSKIPIGIFYQNEHIPTYQERISARIPDYLENPPSKQAVSDQNNQAISSIDKLLAELRVDKQT